MEILSMVAQFILCITIIVGLHELGHLATAKWFGMRVEKYFIGFPPKIFSFKRGETEYGVGAIPLGGFVKISGMIDESMDKEAMKLPPQPYEFRSKPAWQRLIVMLGGIIVNVVTGLMMYIGILYFGGVSRTPMQEINKEGIATYPNAELIGLRTGDKILAYNDKPIQYIEDVANPKIFFSEGHFTIERAGEKKRVDIPTGILGKINPKEYFMGPLTAFMAGKVTDGSFAQKAGMQKGDKIVNFNNKPIQYFHEFEREKANLKGKTVNLVLERNGKNVETKVEVGKDGKIGFEVVFANRIKTETEYLSFGNACTTGFEQAFGSIFFNAKGMGKVFTGEVPLDAVSGPLGMYQIFPPDWSRFWLITAMLSMWLAFINLLPIPALDGGHALFTTIEMISGRKIPEKFLEYAQMVGMVLLLGLMVLILGLDVFKIIKSIIGYFG
jgi:regulator of sigma E protease